MNQKNLAELKSRLEKRKKEVIEQLDTIGHQVEGAEINFQADFPQYGDSTEDNAVEVADYTKNLSFERELEKELSGVEKALKRIADKTYGRCTYCGKEIELERLEIRPESTSCVNCKKALKGEK